MGSKESESKDTSELTFDQTKVAIFGGPVVSEQFRLIKTSSGMKQKAVVPVDPRQAEMKLDL